MKSTTVTSADLFRRGSWAPSDFLYETGRRVVLRDGRAAIVAGQYDRDVFVAEVERVPGSRTEFCCSMPFVVSVFDIRPDTSTARRR